MKRAMPKEHKDAMFLPRAPPPRLQLPLPLVSLTRYTPPILLHARAICKLVTEVDEVDDVETGFNSFGCVSIDASTSGITSPRRAAPPIQSNLFPSQ